MMLPNFPRRLRVFLTLATLLICATSQHAQSLKKIKLEKLDQVIELSKSPCYGSCPVFRLVIYEKGIISYEGERNTRRLGLYAKRLSDTTYQRLLTAFQTTNLWQFKDVYRGQYPDAPTVSITYYEEGDVKTIIGKDGRPTKVLELEAMLDDIANSDQGWELLRPAIEVPENVITSVLIVQLQNGKAGDVWARKYRRQELELVEHIAPDTNYWLIRYNPDVITPAEMLTRVRGDAEVVGAEFNKKLDVRY